MLNRIIIMGRLTRDPELRYTNNQTPVASFTLAVDRDFADKQTNERATDFIDCVAWRSTADFVHKYFAKGSLAAVTGRLQIRDWVDKEGNKRRSAEIIVDNIYFGDSKRRDSDNESQIPSYDRSTGPAPGDDQTVPEGPFSELSDEGELPF